MTTEQREAGQTPQREPRVLNRRYDFVPPEAIYVGRPSKWGNPFSHVEGTLAEFLVDSRREAVEKFREWVLGQPDLLLQVRTELRGKDLVCWCSPKECHADVLLELANTPEQLDILSDARASDYNNYLLQEDEV
jgi:hypothetical protein